MEFDRVMHYLPHRFPFLMVDKVLEIQPSGPLGNPAGGPDKVGTKVVAIKNVTSTESCFQGHFPGHAVFPGVYIIEAMAQTASFSLYPYFQHDTGRLCREFRCVLVGVEGARFRRPVYPGDTMRMESVVTKCRGKLWVFDVKTTVGGALVAEAGILANLLMKSEGI
ncbi:MAG: hypothetical protein A2583_08725 [Bdellovibrionales bacterium RIFOXYD1_FULL_53_11]|nr:MAG: hypothetical protein A2583_08725 [Bdellovibrionales bacterium RIFOXYD1_FULL_53_11]